MQGEIVGIVLPLIPEHVARVFEQGRDVLVKYISRIPEKPQDFRLQRGMKVLFYVSRTRRKIAGEGEISDISFIGPLDAWKKFGKRLVLSHQELLDYTTLQPGRTLDKPLMVLELSHLRGFRDGITYYRNVSMVGEYLKPDVYDQLVTQSHA